MGDYPTDHITINLLLLLRFFFFVFEEFSGQNRSLGKIMTFEFWWECHLVGHKHSLVWCLFSAQLLLFILFFREMACHGVRDEATEKSWLNAAHCSCLGCLNNLHDLYLYYNLNPSTTYKKKDIKLSTHRWTDELFLFLKGHHYSLHKRVYVLYRMGYRLFSMQKNLVGVWPHYDLNAGFKSMRYRHVYNENP